MKRSTHPSIISADPRGSDEIRATSRLWTQTPIGRQILRWEQDRYDETVADLFGYYAIQFGLDAIDALRLNRMPSRILALSRRDADPGPEHPLFGVAPSLTEESGDAQRDACLRAIGGTIDASAASGSRSPLAGSIGMRPMVRIGDFDDLPFGDDSIDLLAVPHVLEFATDPHRVLHEASRVLRPEGRLILSGINPIGLLGLARRLPFADSHRRLRSARLLGLPRLRDWLQLLGFETGSELYGAFRPPFQSQRWFERTAFMERVGDRLWPICGSAYFMVAIKRVRGMRVIPAWKTEVPRRKAVVITPAQFHRRSTVSPSRSPKD